MSEIHYACPGCRNTITVPARAGGKTLSCPICEQKAIVPVSLPLEEWEQPLLPPSLRQRTAIGRGRWPTILLTLSLIGGGSWAWFALGRAVERDSDNATPPAMSSKNEGEASHVKGRRDPNRAAGEIDERLQRFSKRREDLRQKEDRERAFHDEAFWRWQKEAIAFRVYAETPPGSRPDKRFGQAIYERLHEAEAQLIASTRRWLSILRQQEQLVQGELAWRDYRLLDRLLLEKLAAAIRDNIRKVESFVKQSEKSMMSTEELRETLGLAGERPAPVNGGRARREGQR